MGREDRLQASCTSLFRAQFKDREYLHIANERQTSRRRGAKLKRMGVRAGAADIFIPEPIGDYAGLWIELKVENTTYEDGKAKKNRTYPSQNQRAFLTAMHQRGYAVAVAWNSAEFLVYCKRYFAGKPIECDYAKDMIERELSKQD